MSMNWSNQTVAVVLAGGVGRRMAGSTGPKQLMAIAGKPMIVYSLRVFDQHPQIDQIVVVLAEDFRGELEQAIAVEKFSTPVVFVSGGETRQESSYRAMAFIASQKGARCVLIHDAARPFVSHKLVDDLLAAMKDSLAAEPTIPVVDTIACVKDGFVIETLDRKSLGAVQTPQAFRFDVLWDAHQEAQTLHIYDASDDVFLVSRKGVPVRQVAGLAANRKVTYLEDLEWAERWARENLH